MKVRCLFQSVILIAALVGMSLFSPDPALAAKTWVVNTLSDVANANCNNSCSLPDAIALAASGDTITFSVTGMIYLNHGGLTIAKNLTISGPGAARLMITGVANYEVFHITAGKTVTISGLTITRGKSTNGGGITNEGTLTLDQCTISDHLATGDGGGLYNLGTATVNRSTFSGNHASYGGGIKNEAGVLNVTNSTFTGNVADNRGGGIDSGANSSLNVTNSTFQGNSASSGGGIGNLSSVTTARNVLMADNWGWNCSGSFASGSTNNLSTDAYCSPGFTQVSLEQLALGPLNGNPAYLMLQTGSAAIDAGTNTGCPASDEQGKPRPQDGNDDGLATCDIGSYEAWPVHFFDHVLYLPFVNRN